MADELTSADFPQGELLFYTSKDGKVKMEIRVECETIWMSQQMMAELFQTSKQNVAKHLKRIFEQGELQEESVVNYWLTTAADGKNYSVAYYNLDAIISVGYRVNSIRGTQFRIWATQQLSELMRKGFVLDKERLKNPPIKGATALPDYFDDLLEQIIRRLTSAYLWGHLALMVGVLMFWLPVYFVLYGGVQAVVLLCLLRKGISGEVSDFRRRSICLFSWLEWVYTVALLFVGARGYFELSLDCLKGTSFNNPEFFPFYYSLLPNALYAAVALIWGVVYAIRRVRS